MEQPSIDVRISGGILPLALGVPCLGLVAGEMHVVRRRR